MEPRWSLKLATLASFVALSFAIPASLVEEIKAGELRDNKVKRAHPQLGNLEEHGRDVPFYSKPTAIKRGTNNLGNLNTQQHWDQEQNLYPEIRSSLFPDTAFDDKTVAEYEKGFHYGTNREKLDEALENAVLKSELYGDPSPSNQYRYYDDGRRRRRRDARRIRSKRDADLTPEEILTILSLYENEKQNGFGKWDTDEERNNESDEEENWLGTPVYPHATDHTTGYFLEDKRGRWGGYGDANKKRFMVAKKKNDPTRELRYLNGPNKNDYYTLSQLLSNRREPNVPLYHRLVL